MVKVGIGEPRIDEELLAQIDYAPASSVDPDRPGADNKHEEKTIDRLPAIKAGEAITAMETGLLTVRLPE